MLLFYRFFCVCVGGGGGDLKSCDFDEDFITHVEETVGYIHAGFSATVTDAEDKERAQNNLNYDITIEETEAVFTTVAEWLITWAR